VTTALVIGAGPAGLMAADVLAAAGLSVTLADAMPSPGRKFLMAGKSGLNLTKDQDLPGFLAAYGPRAPALDAALRDFGPDAAMAWARGLGQPVFTGSSGRVFPAAMKASPLLRAWLRRLDGLSVALQTRWRWQGWQDGACLFGTPDGPQTIRADVTILALGGASWARLGSDGAWAAQLGGQTAPFLPANMGFAVGWSRHMARHFGHPVKGVALTCGTVRLRAEFVISARGIEGGGIYAHARAMREGAALVIDLLPDQPLAALTAKLARMAPGDSVANRLRRLGLDPVRTALAQEWARPLPTDPNRLAALLKSLTVRHAGPRPLDEAISTAGGLRWDALDGYRLTHHTATYAAGEMLDWEAPTGGYLITACLATGRAAARQALAEL